MAAMPHVPFARLAALALALWLVAACRDRRPTADAGAAAPRPRAAWDAGPVARRVVSLVPNTTEIAFALGAGAQVVGVSRFDDYPPEATRLPRVGGMVDPSFEAIATLRPDAVIGIQGPVNRAVLDRLADLGVRAVFPRVESVAEVHDAIDVMAALLGRQDNARALHERIRERTAAVQRAVRGRARPKVLAVFGQRPVVVAGEGSWFSELIELAGGTNAAHGTNRYPMYSLEQVMATAPDVVLDMTTMEGHGDLATAWAGYAAIPAVRNRRVVRLNDPAVLRPGPRLGDALVVIARAVHPGLRIP